MLRMVVLYRSVHSKANRDFQAHIPHMLICIFLTFALTQLFSRALEELTNANERFEHVRSVAIDQAEGNGEGDAARLRQHFQGLKSNYVQLQTKDGFIKKLNSNQLPTEEECDALEEEVKNGKASIKSTKTINQQTSDDMINVIKDLANTYESFVAESNFLRKQIDEIATSEEIRNNEVTGEGPNVEECESLLSKLRTQSKATISDVQKREDDIKRLEREIAMAQLRIDSLQVEAAGLRKAGGAESMKDAERRRQQKSEEWCDSMTRFLSKISGVTIVDISDCEIILSIIAKTKKYDCSIQIHKTSGTIENIALEPCDIEIKDIQEAVMETRHVDAAVQEIRQKILESLP